MLKYGGSFNLSTLSIFMNHLPNPFVRLNNKKAKVEFVLLKDHFSLFRFTLAHTNFECCLLDLNSKNSL